MTNQDGKPPKTADLFSRAPILEPAINATTAGDDENPPLTVVVAPTAVGDITNVDPEIRTTLLSEKFQPNFWIPTLPAKLYHSNDKSHEISQDGKAVFVYRVTVSMDLHKRVNTRVDAVQVLKEIFGKIKAVDPTAILVPVRNQGQETNSINKGIYIPTGKEKILDYLSHSFSRNNWLGYFVLRSHYSLCTLKEQPGFRAFLNDSRTWLSQTQFHTERCAEIRYIQVSHTAITRRDDLTATIKNHIDPEIEFSLIPGKRLLTKGKEKVAYTGLFIECPQDNYDLLFNTICKVFRDRHEELKNLAFVQKKNSGKNLHRLPIQIRGGTKQNASQS